MRDIRELSNTPLEIGCLLDATFPTGKVERFVLITGEYIIAYGDGKIFSFNEFIDLVRRNKAVVTIKQPGRPWDTAEYSVVPPATYKIGDTFKITENSGLGPYTLLCVSPSEDLLVVAVRYSEKQGFGIWADAKPVTNTHRITEEELLSIFNVRSLKDIKKVDEV